MPGFILNEQKIAIEIVDKLIYFQRKKKIIAHPGTTNSENLDFKLEQLNQLIMQAKGMFSYRLVEVTAHYRVAILFLLADIYAASLFISLEVVFEHSLILKLHEQIGRCMGQVKLICDALAWRPTSEESNFIKKFNSFQIAEPDMLRKILREKMRDLRQDKEQLVILTDLNENKSMGP